MKENTHTESSSRQEDDEENEVIKFDGAESSRNHKKLLMDKLTDEQVLEFKEAFQAFDKKGTGSISVKEIGVVLRTLGLNPSEDEIGEIIEEVDKDHSGTIDFIEFLGLLKNLSKEGSNKDVLLSAFKIFDNGGGNKIYSHLLRYELSKPQNELTEKEVDEIINEVDADEDGYIDYEGFKRILENY